MTPQDEDFELKAALYALGTLTRTEALAYEEDLDALGEDRRTEFAEYAGVVELLSFAEPQAEPPVATRQQLNAFMAAEPRAYNPYAGQETTPQTPTAATELLTIRRDEGRWFEVSKGMHVKPVFADPHKGSTSYLVRFEPGAVSPLHRHPQVEECVVIEGDFRVDGKVLGPGDYHCAMAGSIHDRPHTVDGALVLIIASEPYEVLEH